MDRINFSFIAPYRNREYGTVKNFLESLASQTERSFEVIFINSGSDEKLTKEIEKLTGKYSFCSYSHTETRGLLWNKSYLINIGINVANGKYVIVADIDLIFPADYLENIKNIINDEVFLTHRCYYLLEGFDISYISQHKKLPINFIGLLAVQKDKARKIGGFDEFYQIWGAEDDDFITRLEYLGLQRRIIDVSDIPIWHQWHPTASPKKPTPWYLAELNYLYLNKSQSLESTDYAKVLTLEDRPAFNAYLNGSYKSSSELKISRNDHLAFLEFYQGFSKLLPEEMCFLEYKNNELIYDKGKMLPLVNFINKALDRFKKFHYRLVREENIRMADTVKFKDVKDFLEYFIGVNRGSIEDYCYYTTETKLILVIKKA